MSLVKTHRTRGRRRTDHPCHTGSPLRITRTGEGRGAVTHGPAASSTPTATAAQRSWPGNEGGCGRRRRCAHGRRVRVIRRRGRSASTLSSRRSGRGGATTTNRTNGSRRRSSTTGRGERCRCSHPTSSPSTSPESSLYSP